MRMTLRRLLEELKKVEASHPELLDKTIQTRERYYHAGGGPGMSDTGGGWSTREGALYCRIETGPNGVVFATGPEQA